MDCLLIKIQKNLLERVYYFLLFDIIIDSSWKLFVICSTLKIHSGFSLTLDLFAAHFSASHLFPHNCFANILCVFFSCSFTCLAFTAHSQLSSDPYSLQGLTWHISVLMTTVFFLRQAPYLLLWILKYEGTATFQFSTLVSWRGIFYFQYFQGRCRSSPHNAASVTEV